MRYLLILPFYPPEFSRYLRSLAGPVRSSICLALPRSLHQFLLRLQYAHEGGKSCYFFFLILFLIYTIFAGVLPGVLVRYCLSDVGQIQGYL